MSCLASVGFWFVLQALVEAFFYVSSWCPLHFGLCCRLWPLWNSGFITTVCFGVESGDLGGLGGSGTTILPVSSSLSVLAWVSGMWISLCCILPSVIVDSSTIMVVGGVSIGWHFSLLPLSPTGLWELSTLSYLYPVFPNSLTHFFSFSTCHLLSLSCTVCFSLLHLQVKIWKQNWSMWGKSSRSLEQN